ncbi:hypothetical protein BJF85_17800 [Saccharomonospora sp. CUA-673]|nr:hypothetical protein BJF85_17800 [Saccharomonospora sp. CUA-673]
MRSRTSTTLRIVEFGRYDDRPRSTGLPVAGSQSTLRQTDLGLVMISRAYAAGIGPIPSIDAPVSDMESAVSMGMCT